MSTIKVKTNQLNEDVEGEVFTISISDFTNYVFELSMQWSNISVSFPIKLTTKEIMEERINNVLDGPNYNDYYAAAVYQMESGKEFKKGLQWINKAIEITDKVTWWDLRVKAKLLMEIGEYDKSLKVAKEGLVKAEKEKREYEINGFKNLIRQLQK